MARSPCSPLWYRLCRLSSLLLIITTCIPHLRHLLPAADAAAANSGAHSTSTPPPKQVYIAYLGHKGSLEAATIEAEHHEMLVAATGRKETAEEALLYNYKHSFRGFAARLSKDEVSFISKMPGVLSVIPSTGRSLQTTRSWEFLGLENSDPSTRSSIYQSQSDKYDHTWHKAEFGEDVIIGLLDTGIWPESESFQDDSLPPIPTKWKGICEVGVQFSASVCNRKLIGGRMYLKGYESYYGPLNVTATGEFLSARDKDGHGTHTSSTAAGNFVSNASTFGFGDGIAKGGAPGARIAMYKVCWPIPGVDPNAGNVCFDADMLAALDDGIHDGVDLFSISIGHHNPQRSYFEDAVAFAGFHAMLEGVPVFCAAGNDGPSPGTVSNVAPWLVTVAASTIDRNFPSPATLGNGTVLQGESISSYALDNHFYPLIFAGDAGKDNNPNASQCLPNTLDPSKVKGKVVLCMRGQGTRVGKSQEVLNAGGAAYILGNSPANGNEIAVDAYLIPGTAIGAADAAIAQEYIKSNGDPKVNIQRGNTTLGIKPAPIIPSFSSRGPNSLNPQILKPDIAAPGVNILAAWTGANSPTGSSADPRRVSYNIMSGTSMACPHAAGIGALLKSIHPTWSPAAIKSAIMTTAKILDNTDQPISTALKNKAIPFDYGAGEIDPMAAVDPGLVYDIQPTQYLYFLCNAGLNSSEITLISGQKFSCGSQSKHHNAASKAISNLNYPSVAVTNLTATRIITRTVTNVGSKSHYRVSVDPPAGIDVHISPKSLHFEGEGESRKFKIKLRVLESSKGEYVFGSYSWSDGTHIVRSPIVVQA